jgi:hypothetical protein
MQLGYDERSSQHYLFDAEKYILLKAKPESCRGENLDRLAARFQRTFLDVENIFACTPFRTRHSDLSLSNGLFASTLVSCLLKGAPLEMLGTLLWIRVPHASSYPMSVYTQI